MDEQNDRKGPRLDLLLINPCLDFVKAQKDVLARRVEKGVVIQNCPSPGVAYLLASAKKCGLRAKFIDMVADGISIQELLQAIERSNPAVVGFTALTVQIKAAGTIARAIKSRFNDMLICAGGIHTTVMPFETLKEFEALDFVVCGEGERVIGRIFECLKAGRPLSDVKGVVTRESKTVTTDLIEDLDELPFPAWEEMDLSKYGGIYPHRTKRELPLWTSRGCPYSCIFCVRPFGRRRRHRSVESVITELHRDINEFGCESIAFIDETFIANVKWNDELFRRMISEGISSRISWSCETRIDSGSPDLFRLMKKAGCYYVFFGIENADDAILASAKKKINTAQVKQTIRWAQEAGLVTSGSFIIGLPGETEETVRKSIDLAIDLNLYSVTFPIAVPFPGTALRRMALNNEHGMRILTNNWDDYDKQYPGVMESVALPIEKRRELQKLAYEMNPKKKIDEYIRKLEGRQNAAPSPPA